MPNHLPTAVLSARMRAYCQTNRRELVAWSVPIAAWVFCYAAVIAALVRQWSSNTMYSYGVLIPLISLYLVWERRERLAHVPAAPSYWWGGAVLAVGLIMFTVGAAGGVLLAQEISLIVTIAGATLWAFGRRVFREMAFPIGYLLLMIPLWDVLISRLHFPFQVFSATLGVALLQLVGIPVHQDGVYIWLPNITLEVAKACSGVNYLIAVVAIGIPLAALFLRGWGRRILLVAFALVVAALSNSLRVALIGLLAYNGISGALHGPLHVLQGLFVSFVGYGAIFVGLWVLRPSRATPRRLERHPDVGDVASGPRAARSRTALFVLGLVFVGVGSYVHVNRPTPIPLNADLEEFPRRIGQWTGIDAANDENVYTRLGVDHELSRVYRADSGQAVRLYVGYFESQTQDKELINYKTDELFEGGKTVDIVMNGGLRAAVNERVQRTGEGTRVTLFWYLINGRVVADKYWAKAYTVWDRLIHHRTNGAVVMVTAEVRGSDDRDVALTNSGEFIRAILPLVGQYVP